MKTRTLAVIALVIAAIGLTPSAASAELKAEICLNSGFCFQIVNTELPSTPVSGGSIGVSGSAAGASAETDLTLQ